MGRPNAFMTFKDKNHKMAMLAPPYAAAAAASS
jgi:hypothetical protein